MSDEGIKRIQGGWKNVPEHLKTKTDLSKIGLKPIGGPVAEVWNSYQWCKLYDVKDTEEKKKLTANQVAGIEKARITREENQRRRMEAERKREEQLYREEERKREERRRKYGYRTFGSWYEKDFIILDTETTDLDGEIIEISIVDREGNVLLDSLVKPKGPISKEAYSIHGISDTMLSTAPTWPEIFPTVKTLLKDRLILIYNDEFDCQIINNTCDVWGLERPSLITECVMRSYAWYYELNRWVSLQHASGDFVSHRSLEDCLSTLKVIKNIWSELGLGIKNNTMVGVPGM